MYDIKCICKSYRSQKVLKRLTLSLPDKGFVSILGESGSGKTTLFNMLALLDTPDSGSIYFNHEDITKFNEQQKGEYRKFTCSLLYQKYHLVEHLTVEENIRLPLCIQNKRHNYMQYVNLLQMRDKLDRYPDELSGGEQQRVALIRTLTANTPVILADEPTGALDSKNAKLIMDILKEESKSKLVLMVTHNKTLAKEYGDQIVHLNNGKIDSFSIVKTPPKQHKRLEHHKSSKIKFKYLLGWTLKVISKKKRKYIASIVCYSLCLAGLLIVMGLKTGLVRYCDYSMTKRLDYGYINIYSVKNGYLSQFNPAMEYALEPYLDAIEINVSYDQILNNLSFSTKTDYYEVKVMEGIDSVIVNELFYETFNEELTNFRLKGELDVPYKNYAETIQLDLPINVENLYYEGRIYNVAKLYIPRAYIEDQFKNTPLPLISEKEGKRINLFDYISDNVDEDIYLPKEILIKDRGLKEEIYTTLLNLENVYPKYNTEELKEDYTIIETSDEMLRTTFKDLLDSGELVLMMFLLTLIMSVISLISLMLQFSIKEREKEFGIIRSYGGTKQDIIKLILLESTMFTIASLLIASIVTLFTKMIVFGYSDVIFNSNNRIDLIINESTEIWVVLLVSVAVLLVSSISPILSSNKTNIIEVVNDD